MGPDLNIVQVYQTHMMSTERKAEVEWHSASTTVEERRREGKIDWSVVQSWPVATTQIGCSQEL